MATTDLVGRVGILSDSFPPQIDGVANTALNYTKFLWKNHEGALVIAPKHPDQDEYQCPYPIVRYPSVDTRKLVGYPFGIPFNPQIIKEMDANPLSLLHMHCPMISAVLARELTPLFDVPTVMTYNTKYDLDIADIVKSKAISKLTIKAMVDNVEACDEVWGVSNGAIENLRSLGYRGDAIVMPNGVDLPLGRVSDDKIVQAVSEYNISDNIPVFLFVGRLIWTKGIKLILDALAKLKLMNVDFKMVFIGDGRDYKEIKKHVAFNKLNDRCILMGYKDDREFLRAWYARANLFLFPSYYDTNGLVVREAAASSTPSVLLSGSAAAEGVVDGVNGFLIENDTDMFAQKLNILSKNLSYVKHVGENAASQLYLSWEDAVDMAYDRYKVVIDNFKSGKTKKKKKRFIDRALKAQGRVMAVAAGKELK